MDFLINSSNFKSLEGTSVPSLPLDEIVNRIQNILYEKNYTGNKSKIQYSSNRINFACPYCGDSKDSKKKRGNLYTDSMIYHCFNCGIHRNARTLLRDFNKLGSYEFIEVKSYVRNSLGYYNIIDKELLSKFLISKEDLKNKFNFKSIENSPAHSYLLKRNIRNFDDFFYDSSDNSIIILNLDNDNNVLGYIKRLLNKNIKNKYLSYKLSKINEQLGIEHTEELKSLDEISLIFNIFRVDLNNTITIFEGPFDAHFFKNAIALNGILKGLPMDIENKRYLLDNDKIGIQTSQKLLKNGESVFLWNKFLKDFNIKDNIKDFNDLINYFIYNNKYKIYTNINFDDYFSNDKLDLYFL